jgi:hypothetical protein
MSILQLAKRLNLDVDRIENGETLNVSLTVNSPEHYLQLFGPVNGITRTHRPFARHHLTESCCRSCYNAGLLHFSDYVSGATSAIDPEIGAEFFKRRFPMAMNLTIAKLITVTKNTEFPPGSAPVFIACENLIFNGGAYVLRNTSFTLWVTEQLSIISGGDLPYHIGILGARGGDGGPGNPGPALPQAVNGTTPTTPSPGICTGAPNGGVGTAGIKGNDGQPGGPGHDGLPSVLSSINVASFAAPQAPLVVFGQSGEGGHGGAGGAGGPGQQGGNGGNGCSSGCEGTNGGDGGTGGQGGNGVTGGQGGNAANGGQLHVNLAADQQGPNFFVYDSAMAKPGSGGALGAAGARGAPGTGGKGGDGSSNGLDGSVGTPGTAGVKGADGTQFGAPPQLITGNYAPPPKA